ncbi:hypothetical protein AB6D30_07705 [Pectobacterium brasiliense]|uniref:hypothetical protein n=1 Tax=Pectobacterium TaxID=122277 RepID=UPI00057DB312|nr:hypothetical protein [Pectobacterium brasiliense]KHT01968.1 hypothetical protein RC91_13980 [Pectobacterium brasiliense]MBA0195216.1 crotonobetainyl-CoA--carnitine CoA-transferase [Pectobacterium brasiliense]MBN3069174.1 crotonobetainyl-CoA--carnitine CoA-transferase [Pectobacterium brasiliense]MBN3092566.1 crotonobetainyl-CoA--carnitine CoA-transferase [Pectobacterium brasiliense]MBN3099207.1 crotonobetainyl-CoA--carnitine CoA-transferase [Pectobacterium brasiliense]
MAKYKRTHSEFTSRSDAELQNSDDLNKLLASTLPFLGQKWDVHLPVFLTAPSIARILWLNQVYLKGIDVPGRIIEFGSQWGASINVMLMLKLIYEPWNAGREIISFSTFSDGFVTINEKDGGISKIGDYAVLDKWEVKLEEMLNIHASRSPIGVSDNFSIINGDVCDTFPKWLEDNPEAIISHVHFDMDVYQPTHDMLKLILPRMPKGALLIFDELNCPSFPGETLAVQEVLGIHRLSLRKSQYQPYSAYSIIE